MIARMIVDDFLTAIVTPGRGHDDIAYRLKHHFAVFAMLMSDVTSTEHAYSTIIEGYVIPERQFSVTR